MTRKIRSDTQPLNSFFWGGMVSDTDSEATRSAYETIKACINRESDLVIRWLTMLVVINAGLMAGMLQLITNDPSIADDRLLGAIIAVTAILSTGFIFFAIDAASDQFEYLRKRYLDEEQAYSKLGLPRPFGDENEEKRTKFFPRYFYKVMGKPFIIPTVILVLWLLALVVINLWWVSTALAGGIILAVAVDQRMEAQAKKKSAEGK